MKRQRDTTQMKEATRNTEVQIPQDLPDPGIELRSPALQADSLCLSTRKASSCIQTATAIYSFSSMWPVCTQTSVGAPVA